MNTMILFLIAISLLGFLPMIFIPYWTRKTESFGVSIPEKIYHTAPLKQMRKQYAMVTGIASVIIIVIFWLISMTLKYNEDTIGILFAIMITVYLIGTFFIYLKFHWKMKRMKEKENWAKEKSQLIVVDTAFHNQKLTYSNLWFMISFVITLATIVITFQFYDRIPEMVPMNYDFSGEVTNWAHKSYRSVLMMPMTQMFMIVLFLFINIMIAKSKQQISAVNPKQSSKQNITFRRRWSAFIIMMGTAFIIMFSLIQFSMIFPINQQIIFIMSLVITFGAIVGAIVLSITTGQGGSRVNIETNTDGKVIDRDDDQYWKLGQFYFNKNDPAIFLEKRFGVGWTNNWAHPLSWIIIIVVILLAAGIPILLTM